MPPNGAAGLGAVGGGGKRQPKVTPGLAPPRAREPPPRSQNSPGCWQGWWGAQAGGVWVGGGAEVGRAWGTGTCGGTQGDRGAQGHEHSGGVGDMWGCRGRGDTRDTGHGGLQGHGVHGDTKGYVGQRGTEGTGTHRDTGVGLCGDTECHAWHGDTRGAAPRSVGTQRGDAAQQGLTECPLAPTAGPGCWASVPFTAIPSRSAQHRPSGLRHRCHARGGHGGGGLRCAPHGAHLSAGLPAASRGGGLHR